MAQKLQKPQTTREKQNKQQVVLPIMEMRHYISQYVDTWQYLFMLPGRKGVRNAAY